MSRITFSFLLAQLPGTKQILLLSNFKVVNLRVVTVQTIRCILNSYCVLKNVIAVVFSYLLTFMTRITQSYLIIVSGPDKKGRLRPQNACHASILCPSVKDLTKSRLSNICSWWIHLQHAAVTFSSSLELFLLFS